MHRVNLVRARCEENKSGSEDRCNRLDLESFTLNPTKALNRSISDIIVYRDLTGLERNRSMSSANMLNLTSCPPTVIPWNIAEECKGTANGWGKGTALARGLHYREWR